MVGKMRRRCSARTCLRADERDLVDGGALSETGVERPLLFSSTVRQMFRYTARRVIGGGGVSPCCRTSRAAVARHQVLVEVRGGAHRLGVSRAQDMVVAVVDEAVAIGQGAGRGHDAPERRSCAVFIRRSDWVCGRRREVEESRGAFLWRVEGAQKPGGWVYELEKFCSRMRQPSFFVHFCSLSLFLYKSLSALSQRRRDPSGVVDIVQRGF